MLVTPYSQAVTDHECEFLAAAGYEVIHAKGYALAAAMPIARRHRNLARTRLENVRPSADVYFLSCANISVFSVIGELEARLDRPVITSNQAVIWDALCALGVDDRRGGLGRLFERASTGINRSPDE